MSRKFHNLAGCLRDLQAARRAGPTGDGDSYALWTAFVDEVECALEEVEGPGDADDAEVGDADASDELDSQLELVGTHDGGQPGRHDERGRDSGTPASLLDALLDGMAGPQRAAAQLELDTLRRDAMAGAQPGKRRVSGGTLEA